MKKPDEVKMTRSTCSIRLLVKFSKLLHVLVMTSLTLFVVDCVEIRRLIVPRWIQNGTEESVVLDCDYVYNENDLRLVVKWFFGENLEPVYQWIPELGSRHTSGVLKGRLDLDFSVNSADAYSRFRALRILRPTTELGGRYTCLVTSLAGQDSREQNMVVFVPAEHFELSFTETSESEMNVTCEARGLFPVPELKLIYSERTVPDATATIERRPNGTFDISVHRTFFASDLSVNGDFLVECYLELPGTNYARTKRVEYYPDVPAAKFENSSALQQIRICGGLIFTLLLATHCHVLL